MTKRKPKHVGFYMDVDGEPAHFLADPNMTPETQHALEELVRAARKILDAKTDNLQLCVRCGVNKTGAKDGICTQCKIAELWASDERFVAQQNGSDNLRLCQVCGQYECVAPAVKCWRCREQDAIDREDWLDDN